MIDLYFRGRYNDDNGGEMFDDGHHDGGGREWDNGGDDTSGFEC